MKLFEFYGHALNSHKRANKEASKGLHKFNIDKLLKRDQFKTINELSGGRGLTNWSSVKGSIRVKSTYTSLTKSIETVFKYLFFQKPCVNIFQQRFPCHAWMIHVVCFIGKKPLILVGNKFF